MMERQEMPEMMGTPMPVKTPLNFRAMKAKIEKQNKKAERKLMSVAFVSIFFIVA